MNTGLTNLGISTLKAQDFKYIEDPAATVRIANPSYSIQLEDYVSNDLWRYVAYLYWEKDEKSVDFDKHIRKIIDKFLKLNITDEDLARIEELKQAERDIIEKANEIRRPKFDWLKKSKKKGKDKE